MEGELWLPLYRLIWLEAALHPRRSRQQYHDGLILCVYAWAVHQDRPISWACQQGHWPKDWRWMDLPSPATLSRRVRRLSFLLLLEGVLQRLNQLTPWGLVHDLDPKSLAVGPFSKDHAVRKGHVGDCSFRGYDLFAVWGRGVVPEVWQLGPASLGPSVVAVSLGRQLQAAGGAGYVLGDSQHDSNPLHTCLRELGLQLLAPRKRPQTQLSHREHDLSRLRAIELLEQRPGMGIGAEFGPQLYALRTDIERHFGQLVSFGGGLTCLPAWVRRPRRVVLWVALKLILNGLRLCRLRGLLPEVTT